jgi:membrane dipeptidase
MGLLAARPGEAVLSRRKDMTATCSRRQALQLIGAGALIASGFGRRGSTAAVAQTTNAPAAPVIFMDGHVHVTNRIYWEKIDPWQPTERGWDYARARAAGVNCIIENIGTYGYWNYNYSPKQTLRLIETFHRFAETHADKMGVARSVPEARNIVASGRMAVFLGIESGFDHEGDPEVLAAFYRLGLRSIQFATQSGFNAFADSALAPTQGGQKPDHYHGINALGRELVKRMNELGVLIDITHGTEAVHLQLIEASRAPVVASHDVIRAVSGVGLSDAVLKALAAKGGLVGIHGGAAVVGKRYRKWLAENPDAAANAARAVTAMVGFAPSLPRPAGDRGDYIVKMDAEFAERWQALDAWREDPAAASVLPTEDEWAEQVDYVIKTVGADHVGLGLDLVAGRSAVPATPTGYPALLAALRRITTEENVRKIAGENWLRVLAQAKVG